MKIAMITPYWLPVRGGITTYVSRLAAQLRGSFAVDVHIIARQGGEPGATALGGTTTQFIRRAAKELERLRPDVVHAHGHWYAVVAALLYRHHHPGVRVVFTLHTPFPWRAKWRRYSLGILMSESDFLTGVSADLLGRSLRLFRPRTRTRVTYPGIAMNPSTRSEVENFLRFHGLEGRHPLVAYLGRLSWEGKARGVAQLIRAMKIVRTKIPKSTLMIAGDGPFRKDLEELASTEVPDGVLFLGDVPDPVPLFYTAADVYAHISFQEGLPLALLEALACGNPVVATPVGGVPEVIRDGENGYLVSGDPKVIAARIVELLQNPELSARLAAKGRETVSRDFSWTHAAERFLPLYGGKTRHRVVVTVDLERDYAAPRGSFRGIEEAWPRLLDLFDRNKIQTTVFATADLCAEFPSQLQEIVRRGHSLECHGESHDVAYLSSKSLGWQREAIKRATDAIEACTETRPRGFRAPNFSANGDTIRVLEELGYRYDSSVLPGRVVRLKRAVKRLDFLTAPRDPYHPSFENPALPSSSTLWEIPVAENPLAPGEPIGLGYVNAAGPERALEAVARSAADPCVILIHPWELLDYPPDGVPEWMRTGCSSDSSKLENFLERLCREHEVVTFNNFP